METLPRRPTPKLMRKEDGSLWEASWPLPHEGNAMASLFDDTAPRYWLRELRENPRWRWWAFWRPEYVRTGLLCKTRDIQGFELLPAAFCAGEPQ